jgi:general secretion pathway protein J
MSRSPARGFTLIEIIVVVLVFSIMAAMAYGGLNSVLRTRNGIEDSFARTAAFERAYQRLRADFQNVRYRPIRDAYGDVQPAVIAARDGAVSITRGGWRNPMSVTRATLERVSYKVEDKKLQRSSFRVLDQATDSKPVTLTVLEGVEEMKWRFMDDSREWREGWPAQVMQTPEDNASALPPRAIELTIVTKDWGPLRFVFQTGAGQVTVALLEQIRQSALRNSQGMGRTCKPGQRNCTPEGMNPDDLNGTNNGDTGNTGDTGDGGGDGGDGGDSGDGGDGGDTGDE